ncbi:MAG: hypothetical protein SGARI_004877, partial [Bacillariaceae sp.]
MAFVAMVVFLSDLGLLRHAPIYFRGISIRNNQTRNDTAPHGILRSDGHRPTGIAVSNNDTTRDNTADVHDIEFDPSLTVQDYTTWATEGNPHSLDPSPKWLEQCVDAMENNPTVYQKWNNFDKHNLEDNKEHSVYRLGDCIRLCDQCVNRGRDRQNIKEISVYYGEMACSAMDEPAKFGNYDVLESIFHMVENDTNRTGEFVKPDPDATIIHLRLGDVMEHGYKVDGSVAKGSASYFLVHGGIGAHPAYAKELDKDVTNETANVSYQKSIFSVQDYLEALQKAGASKVVIVGGSHKKKRYKKSKPYAYCLAHGLAFAGLE